MFEFSEAVVRGYPVNERPYPGDYRNRGFELGDPVYPLLYAIDPGQGSIGRSSASLISSCSGFDSKCCIVNDVAGDPGTLRLVGN